MKCTNCGKNNAVYHYHFNLNGEEQEAHLCAECAGNLAPEREFAAKTREVFGDLFDGGLFGGDFFGRGSLGGNLLSGFFGEDPFESFFGSRTWSPFAMLGVPKIEISFPEAQRGLSPSGTAESGKETAQVDPELSKKRQLNALRAQMEAAAKNEEYEKAAQLRNRLRALEKENDK